MLVPYLPAELAGSKVLLQLGQQLVLLRHVLLQLTGCGHLPGERVDLRLRGQQRVAGVQHVLRSSMVRAMARSGVRI